MKTNNQKFLDVIKEIGTTKPKLLLHVCCAPCLAGVIERIEPYFDLTLYYYNPNIMPITEYDKRYLELERLVPLMGYRNIEIIKAPYDNDAFLTFATPLKYQKEGDSRCKLCIANRIEETAKFARKIGADYFCTTLSVSPHKDAGYINAVGEKLSNDYGVRWLYSDYKKDNGFLRSTIVCKQLDVYRQSYCGCRLDKKD